MHVLWIYVVAVFGAALAEAATTAPPSANVTAPPVTCDDGPCEADNYCVMVAASPVCLVCDASCDRCHGFGNTKCNACKLGYANISNSCIACDPEHFGYNCEGVCHCQIQQDNECDRQTGECSTFICAQGWTDAPECQKPCSNKTFGSNCVYTCHCPPGDTCAETNGLCSSNTCEEGYSGAGCQNELPQFDLPPEVVNVTCADATVTWDRWRYNPQDHGDSDAVIGRYELYSIYETDDTNATGTWKLEQTIDHVIGQQSYAVTLTGLVPDADYRFRVDVRQKKGDKFEKNILPGKASDSVIIPCTQPTTVTTTTPLPGTTSRPTGRQYLDSSKFKVEFLDDTWVMVQWAIFANASEIDLNVTLEYYETMIRECALNTKRNVTTVVVPTNGNYNITGLLPWRHYVVKVTAMIVNSNDTDFITRDFNTPEHVPTGSVSDITMSLINKNGGLIEWVELPCSERGGLLLGYEVRVYKLGPGVPATTQPPSTSTNPASSTPGAPGSTSSTANTTTTTTTMARELVFTGVTNRTSFTLETVSPFTRYEVAVVYVNIAGSGSEPPQRVAFQTTEDVPNPPTITAITSGQETISVTLTPPDVTNGVLVQYSIWWSDTSVFTLSKSQGVDVGSTITIDKLEPDTLYNLKSQASTSAGFGPFSPVSTFTTKPNTPPPPTGGSDVIQHRNESCVGVTWTPPVVIAGTIRGYNVTYEKVGSDQRKFFLTNSTSAIVCDLDPGSHYEFTVAASNDAGYGRPTAFRVTTEQADPPIPPIPEILNTSSSSIGVALDPVFLLSPSLTYYYFLFVHEIVSRSARAVSTSNTTCPGEGEIPGNIVRNFSQTDIPTGRTPFVIGDGESYGPYNNSALQENHYYEIYYVISNYFEGICKYSYVKTRQPIRAVNVLPSVLPEEDSDSNTGLIIALVIIALLVVIAIIVVIIICLYRRSRAQDYVPYFNEKDDFDLKVYTPVDDYDPHKWWNTIYSLRESRYIIVGREYLPEGKQSLMNGDVKVSGGGTPVTFNAEFKSLPHGRQVSSVASRRENELKNRFSHLLPYDHSRVVLDPDDNSQGDYVNASYIKGYKHQRAYIAAQSPFDEETVLDFWRMIYQYRVSVVVMMSNLVEDNIVKCTQYWPNSGRVLYGTYILDLIDVQEYASYVIRTVHLRTKMDTEWQVVRIFELTYWPEHGVPADPIPLLEMRHKINVYHSGISEPMVVHCGTGVSRTGVFIALDSLLHQYETEGRISVVSFVRKMRKDRPAMVRTAKQYVFLYEAIFEAMVAGDTMVGHEEFKERYQVLTQKNQTNGHSYLHCQFKSAQDFTRKLFPSMCSNALVPANVAKNRFCEVVPPDGYRPILITPGGMGRTDYINAVFLDSHRRPNHYLITQTPLSTTVIDFWKLVYDHDVHTIVMMEPMTYDDDTSAEYWPEDKTKQYEPFFVETTDTYKQENITIRNLKIVSMQNPGAVHIVRQFQFNAWSDSEFIPKSKSMLLDVIDLVNSWQTSASNDTTPVLVHCKDGATHSGLFIATSVLCEHVLDEAEVDVYHVIKHMKRRRNQIIDTLDQYRFCYKALWDFINMRMPSGTLTSQMSRTRSDIPYKSLSLTSYGSKHEYMPY